MKKITNKLKAIFLMFQFVSSSIAAQVISDDRSIDSLVYTVNDSYSSYSIKSIAINRKGKMYIAVVDESVYINNNIKYQNICLAQGILSKDTVDSIFKLSNYVYKNTGDKLRTTSFSDQETARVRFYHKGILMKNIEDYGMNGSQGLILLYTRIHNTLKSSSLVKWNGYEISKDFFDYKDVDSIEIYEYEKDGNVFYQNGVKAKITLMGNKLNKFIKDSNKFIPIIQNKSVELLSKTDKYAIKVFYKNGENSYMKYNGSRFVKYSYLHFVAKHELDRYFKE